MKIPFNKVVRIIDNNSSVTGIPLPIGTVCLKLPVREVEGKMYPKTYIWIEDIRIARKQSHFCVKMLTTNDKYPRTQYVDSNTGEIKLLKRYIDQMTEDDLEPLYGSSEKDIRATGPKERHGDYYKPSKGYKMYLTKRLGKHQD